MELVARKIGFGFYGISTFVGYLIPNPFLYKQIVSLLTIQFSMSTQLNCEKHFYCGDLGINNKTPNRMLTRRLPHTECINASPCIRLHAFIRLKIRKKEK